MFGLKFTQRFTFRLMQSVFEMAKHFKPCVLYIDEIHELFPGNYEGCTTEAEYLRRMKTEFLALYLNLTVDDNGKL